MTAFNAYRNAIRILKEGGCESPEFDSRRLVEKCIGISETDLLANANTEVPEFKMKDFSECVERRAAGEPLQYILGEWQFYNLDFSVGKGVLIPRPETELLPKLAIDYLRKSGAKIVFDLCSGSGCVGISVAKFFPNCRVYMIDSSDEANYYAKQNIKRYGLGNIELIKGDIKKGFSSFMLPPPDVILSNPPYVPTYEIDTLQRELSHEPRAALDGGIDGLDFYKVLSDTWFSSLRKGGIIAMECDGAQIKGVLGFFLNKAVGGKILKDENGIERVVMLKK